MSRMGASSFQRGSAIIRTLLTYWTSPAGKGAEKRFASRTQGNSRVPKRGGIPKVAWAGQVGEAAFGFAGDTPNFARQGSSSAPFARESRLRKMTDPPLGCSLDNFKLCDVGQEGHQHPVAPQAPRVALPTRSRDPSYLTTLPGPRLRLFSPTALASWSSASKGHRGGPYRSTAAGHKIRSDSGSVIQASAHDG